MAYSRLESLPAELKYEIFSYITDLPTLRSFASSSPVLHCHYRAYRKSILRNCLAHELVNNGLWPDALATFNSRALSSPDLPRTDEKVAEFMQQQYGQWVSNPNTCPDMHSMPAEALQWIATYHLNVIRPLTGTLGRWAIKNLTIALIVSAPCLVDPPYPERTFRTPVHKPFELLKSEEIRIWRALYRYETYHHLFGTNKATGRSRVEYDEVNAVFFTAFTPWDAEALSCIDNFVRAQYRTILSKVAADFRHDDPGLLDAFDEITYLLPYHLDGIVSCGLKALKRFLAIKDHAELVDMVLSLLAVKIPQDVPMRHALTTMAQFHRRRIPNRFPTAADNAERGRAVMEFAGDESPEQAPWGWILLWDGLYANIYGGYVPRELTGTGLVFWDKERWDDMGGGSGFMATQWSNDRRLVEKIYLDFRWFPRFIPPRSSSNDTAT